MVANAEQIRTATVTVFIPPAVPTGEPPISIKIIDTAAEAFVKFSCGTEAKPAVLVCSAFATITNKNGASLFGRRISDGSVKKAVAVAVAFLTICSASTILLMATSNASALDAVYETVSATATVGLSRNLTATLNTLGKLIIIVTMYLGRVGPISLAVALGSKNESQNVISEPTEDISIG